MRLTLDPNLLVTIVLATTRFGAFLAVAPPWSNPGVPWRIRAALAFGLAIVATTRVTTSAALLEPAALITAVVYQAGVGAAIGFLVAAAFSVVQSAGAIIDLNAAFSGAMLYDPFSQAGASPIARLYQLLATGLLFSSGGAVLMVGGLIRSFDVAPIEGFDTADLANLLLSAVGGLMAVAFQIALPLVAALLLAELMLGMLAKAAPQLNVLMLGFGVKSLITLALCAVTIPLLPFAIERLVGGSLELLTGLGG